LSLFESPELKNLSRYVRGYLGGLRSLCMDIEGEEFKYLEGGKEGSKAETIIFIHGMMGSKTQWRSMMRAYTEHYRVISLDVPGLSLHTNFAQKKHTLRQLAIWLEKVILHLRVANVHLVCHSMGCAVGAYFAATRPELVKSATFISFPDVFKNKGELFREYLEEINDIMDSNSLLPLQNFYRRTFASPPTIPNVVLRYNLREVKKYKSRLVNSMHDLASSSPLLMAQIRQIRSVTLILNGDEDRVTPLLREPYWKITLPDAEYLQLSECGHMLHMEKAEFASGLHREFLDRYRAAGAFEPRHDKSDDTGQYAISD